MGLGYYLSWGMLPVMIIITVIFFIKEKISNEETEIYKYILLTSVAMTIFEILSAILFKYCFGTFIYNLIAKMVLISYIIVNFLFCNYLMHVCKRNKLRINILRVLTVVALLLIAFTKTTYVEVDGALAPTGLPVMFTYAYVICLGTYQLFLTIKNRRTIILKKFTPFYLFLFFGLINTLIIYFYPTSFLVGYMWCLTIIIMNFTIENPDVKIAKELAFQKQVADLSSNKTLELLNDMSKELMVSAKKLEAFGKKNVNKDNVEDLKKVVSEFQKDSIKLSDKISSVLDLAMIKGDSNLKDSEYETYDMLDRLKQLLLVEQERNKSNLKIEISDKLPTILYGDENNVVKIVLYVFNLISSLKEGINLVLKIADTRVGRFSRLRFKFVVSDISDQKNFYDKYENNELELIKSHDVNYEIIDNLLKKFNGKIMILKERDDACVSLCINQRVITEYDVISNREENINIEIDYHNFNGKRILIVDNSHIKIKEMKVLLKPYNIEVLSANNLKQMVEMLEDNATFDMIIIDDIISNFEIDEGTNDTKKTIKFIKMAAKYPITSIIMVTPNNKNIEKRYLSYGFDDYIKKPINKENLNKILIKYLNKN